MKKYIQLSKKERQAHLRLDESCVERGGKHGEARGILAFFLGTEIPPKNSKIFLCHACNNEKCTNPKHLYWGTPKENFNDHVESGKFLTPYEKAVLKYGKEEWHKRLKEIQHNNWKAERKEILKRGYEEYRRVFETFPKTRGWKTKIAKELNVSHTHVNRILKWLENNEPLA